MYIIVDPDTKKETENPHFIENQHIKAIQTWVKNGGTLVLLANDTANCEILHFNQLATVFGIRFSDKSRNMVKNNMFEQGAVTVQPGNPIFKEGRKLYLKEISVLEADKSARAVLTEGGDVIMATAAYGKGRVFALGDPWLYNEYVDGKKLPSEFDNFNAARDLSAWLLQTPPVPANEEEADVLDAVEELRLALLSGDRKTLENITLPELSYGHSGGEIENQTAFVDQLASGRSNFTAISFTDQTLSVVGNTAIVRHILSASTNDAGKGPGSVHLSVLLVWVKQNGAWKLLARQAVKKI